MAAPFDEAVERYRLYLIEDIESALVGAQRLRERAIANDLGGAKQSWIDARAGWERSEVFTGEFVPQLDKEIDAWPQALRGFHAIEAKLFGANRTDIEAETQSLVQSLAELNDTVRRIPLTSQGLLNGIAQLAYELGESKVDGGESRVSGTSLADMRNNVLNAILDTGDLRQIDPDRLRELSEELVVTLQGAAPVIGLKKPVLESSAQ
jgi:iron uptake system component EfeO